MHPHTRFTFGARTIRICLTKKGASFQSQSINRQQPDQPLELNAYLGRMINF